jgi:hypothetical protein
MTFRRAPDSIKERMALSSLHTVRVQKARLASRRMDTARLSRASLAWRAERKAWIKMAGRYRHEAGDGYEWHDTRGESQVPSTTIEWVWIVASQKRLTLARISSADLVHRKGLGAWLCVSIKRLIACSS